MKRRLPTTVYALGWVSLLMDIASEMVYPLLPLFLTAYMGASKSTLGLIEGVADSTASLLKVVGGRISDRMAVRKPLLLWGYGLPALLRPLLATATLPGHLLAYRFLERIGKGLRSAPRDALVAESTPQDELGRAYGLHRAMDSAGATIGPLLAALLFPLLGYRGVFWLSALPAVLAVAVVYLGVREKPAVAKPLPPLQLARMPKAYRRFLLSMGVFALGLSSSGFLILRLQELGLSAASTTLVYAMYNLIYALTAYPMGRLADRIGSAWVVRLGLGLFVLAYAGFALARLPWHGIALMVVFALYSAAFESSSRALLATLIPAEQKASAIGLYQTVVGLLLLPASLWFGWFYEHHNATLAFALSASVAAVALGLMQDIRKE